MGANDLGAAHNKARYCRDAVSACFLPIGRNRVFECAFGQHFPRLIRGKPHRLRDVEEHFRIAQVAAADEVSPVECIVNGFETRPRVRPLREFLGQAAVVGISPPVVG